MQPGGAWQAPHPVQSPRTASCPITSRIPSSLRLPLPTSDVHAEYFGVLSALNAKEFNHQYFSPGIDYLITLDPAVGAHVSGGLNEQAPRFFSKVGPARRF